MWKNHVIRHLSLIFIKYLPAILAITCSVKILILSTHDLNQYCYSVLCVNLINVILELFIVGGIYVLGKTLNFCWKHRSLCRTATWGYIYYIIFILFKVQAIYIIPLTIFYVCLVIIMVICYNEIK